MIMATNRADTLDPALLRPGRLDRKIEFPMPDRRQKRLVFQVGQQVRLRQDPGFSLYHQPPLPALHRLACCGRRLLSQRHLTSSAL